MKEMRDFFLNEKPVMALVTLRKRREDVYCSIVSREIDTTYAHTVKIISRMEENGLIESRKEGRKKILDLTDQGVKYADKFIELLNTFNGREKSLEGSFTAKAGE